MHIETLIEARLLILLEAKLRLGLQCIFVNMPMHLRDRKLKTCKLVCMQTMGSGGSEALMASPFTGSGIYHQITELIWLSHI